LEIFTDIKRSSEALESIYSKSEIRQIFRVFWEEKVGESKARSILNAWDSMPRENLIDWKQFIEQLLLGVPYQYALGFCYFCGHRIFVDQRVLIPRPETEELVHYILDKIPESGTGLDFGTGSGAIAIALKSKRQKWTFHAVDVSEGACTIAKHNARINEVQVELHCLDALKDDFHDLPNLDLIVSNPPYIPQIHHSTMDALVVDHEPRIALFVPDDDPFVFYRRIAEVASIKLNAGGLVAVEIHYDGAKGVVDCFSSPIFTNVEIKTDINGHERFVFARKC